MYYFDEIFERIKTKLNFKTDKDVYEEMGIQQGTFTNWRRRNSIPFQEINTLCFKYKLDLNYVINGIEYEKKCPEKDFKSEIIEMIEQLDEKKSEIYYHLIKAEILKEKL